MDLAGYLVDHRFKPQPSGTRKLFTSQLSTFYTIQHKHLIINAMNHGIITTNYRLSLLPLSVAAILIATAVPIELRGPVWWHGGFDYRDIAENLLLYVPLGIVLWKRSLWTVMAAAMLLSTAIEVSQVWNIGRYSSPFDIAANTVGALLGALAWRHTGLRNTIRADTFPVSVLWVAVAAVGIAAILVTWGLPVRSSALSNWNPDFPLLLGNELTQDRPWRGEILEMSLTPSVLQPEKDNAADAQGGQITSSSPIALHGGEGILLPHAVSRDFARAAMHSNSFTVVTRVATDNIIQDGPARIVSFSTDPFNRNFDLGQEGRQLFFRVRTPVSGANGNRYRTETPPILQAGKETLIVASYDGAVARIYLDGQLYGRSNLAAAGCSDTALCDSAVPMIWAVLGGFMAIVALAVFPWRSRLQKLGVALLSGAGALAVPRLLSIAEVPISTQPWTQWTALAGAVAIAFAATGTAGIAKGDSSTCSDTRKISAKDLSNL